MPSNHVNNRQHVKTFDAAVHHSRLFKTLSLVLKPSIYLHLPGSQLTFSMTAAVIIRTRSRCPRGAARRRLRMSWASRRWASVQAMGIRDGDTRIRVGVLFLSGSHAAPSRRRHSRRRRCWSADLLLLLHDVSRSCLECRYHSENNPLRKQPVTRHGVEWPLPDWPDPCDTTWFSFYVVLSDTGIWFTFSKEGHSFSPRETSLADDLPGTAGHPQKFAHFPLVTQTRLGAMLKGAVTHRAPPFFGLCCVPTHPTASSPSLLRWHVWVMERDG